MILYGVTSKHSSGRWTLELHTVAVWWYDTILDPKSLLQAPCVVHTKTSSQYAHVICISLENIHEKLKFLNIKRPRHGILLWLLRPAVMFSCRIHVWVKLGKEIVLAFDRVFEDQSIPNKFDIILKKESYVPIQAMNCQQCITFSACIGKVASVFFF